MFTGANNSVHMPTARVAIKNSPLPHNEVSNHNMSVRNNKLPAANGMMQTRESHQSLSKNSQKQMMQSSSIWDYNEDQKSSKKKITMPLSKALS